jgi:hypothetical protein
MKKLSVLLMLFVVTAVSASAQKGYFGFRAGASASGYYGSDFNEAKDSFAIASIWTPTAGFYVNSFVNDYFWIKTEFNYVNRGYTQQSQGQTLKTNYYYIDAYPITPAFHFKGAQIFAGPSVSLLVAANKDTLVNGSVERISDNELKGFNRYDIGMMAGFEYEFNFGLNLGVRVVRGFTSLYEPNSATKVQTQWFNQNYLITIGYTIGRKPGEK